MLGRKAEFQATNMVIAVLTASLFISMVGLTIGSLSGGYDLTGFNQADLDKFDKSQNLSATIQSAADQVKTTTVDRNAFDFLSDIFSTLISPFKTIYQSFGVVIGLTTSGVQTLALPSIFTDYFIAVLTTIVVIGFVMFRIWMGRRG